MIEITHDSHSMDHRKPFGAVSSGTDVEIRLKVKTDRAIKSSYTVVNRDGGPESKIKMELVTENESEKIYSSSVDTSQGIGLIWYYFEVTTDDGVYYYGNSHDGLGGVGTLYSYNPKSYQITVYEGNVKVPCWYKEGVIYQIFPDRFFNGNRDGKVNRPQRDMVLRADWHDDPSYVKDSSGRVVCYDYFGGNLLGIVRKLNYLKELGVTVIYLNPIFEAASNHKYDTGNYMKIDRMFGDVNVFKKLCKEAKSHGISIVLDGVFSHTGSDSIYFNKEGNYDSIGAYQSQESEYHGWYRFKRYPDEYESWWGIDVLPNVEEENPGYKNLILGDGGVIEKWTRLGAKGWRLDVADELPDSFIKSLRAKLKSVDPEAVLIGEVWEDASNKVSYGERRAYLLGEELDSTMNYPFRENFISFIMGELDAYGLHRRVMNLYENYPRENFYAAMNLVGTHDSDRIIYALGRVPDPSSMSDEERRRFRMTDKSKCEAMDRLKTLSLIQMTFPGVPSIYYGDEVGLEGYSDPYNRRTYPWGREEKELLRWYKKVISIRNSYPVFRWGEFKSIPLGEDVYGYVREKVSFGLVVVNRSEREWEAEIELSDYKLNRIYEVLSEQYEELKGGVLRLDLKPRDRRVYVANRSGGQNLTECK